MYLRNKRFLGHRGKNLQLPGTLQHEGQRPGRRPECPLAQGWRPSGRQHTSNIDSKIGEIYF